MTVAQLTTIWTAEQIALSAAILVCCVVLAVCRRSPARSTAEIQSEPDPQPGTPPQPSVPSTRRADPRPPAVLAAVLAAVAAILAAWGGDPTGVRPDSWSEATVITAGQNYARYGLRKYCGLPLQQVVTDRNPPDPFFLYASYPGGSSLVNGLWQITGVTSVRICRLLPAACSLAALVLWFALFRRIAGAVVAVVAASTMACSYGLLAFADNLDYHAYALLTSTAAMYCYVRAVAPGVRGHWRWFALTAACMFVTACFAWDYHFWMVLFIGLYALLYKSPVRRPYLILLVLPLLAALTLQTVQRRIGLAEALGPRPATQRGEIGFLHDLYRRTLGFEAAVDTPPGLTLAGYPQWLLLRYYKFYGLPVVAALAMLLMLLARAGRAPWRVRNWGDAERLAVVLLVAGTGWWLVMLQHTAVHPRMLRHGLAGYALLMALVWIRCWQTVWSSACRAIARVVAGVLLLTLCYPQIEGLVCSLRIHWQDRYQDERERGDSGFVESRQFSALRRAVPSGAVILTNHNRLPLMRLWSERPVYSGAHYYYPLNDKNARSVLEMRFNHLRSLYEEQLPPLYYVYLVRERTLEEAFKADSMFRLLLLAAQAESPEAWAAVRPLLNQIRRQHSSADTACPVVAVVDDLLVFDLAPAIPTFRRWWGHLSFPSTREFGPPR